MPAEDTEQEAAKWLSCSDRGLDAAEELALELWLAADTLNRVAYLRLKATWQRADRLSALQGLAPAIERAPLWKRPAAWGPIAAVLTLVMGGGAWMAMRSAPEKVYTTGIGKLQAVRLADGTRMELNTDTRLRADVTAARRVVTLDSGEAYFEVVHDENRPFTVYAGNRRITDLGTKFSVFRNGDDVRVTVREGRVKVDVLDAGAVNAPAVAQAGHMVVAKGAEALVLAQAGNAIENELSWRSGMLVFSQQTLAEAADQFNRYNSRKIVVEGAARRIRIGGSFRCDNVDVFVLLLHRGFGLLIDDQGNRIVVSR
jgi:transmembrane sensor